MKKKDNNKEKMPTIKTISILGCGWLGLPLGKRLAERYAVKGSTTRFEKLQNLENEKIKPYLITLNPMVSGENQQDFFETDLLFINVPPRLRVQNEAFHLEQIASLIQEIQQSKIKNLIFISSTSVYDESNKIVTEEDTNETHALAKAEEMLRSFAQKNEINLTILRFGGLMGYDRIPAKYFSGWKGMTTGDTPVNYLHRDDAVRIIEEIIEQSVWNETLNVVSPVHPLRKEIYKKACLDYGYELPEFVTPAEPSSFKIVGTEKLTKLLKYTFLYENPLDFYYEKDNLSANN